MLKASSLFVLLSLLLNACQSTGQTPTPEDVSQTATPTGQATEISSEAPDLSGETITIFQIADPADEYVFSLLTAAQDMATAINESGGVFGAELRLELRESALDAESTIAAYEEIKETDPVLIVVYEPGQQAVLDGLAAEDRIPIFGAGPDAQALYGMDDGYVFTLAPLYADQFGRFLDFVVSNWSEIKPPQAEDFVRVAYLGWDTPLGQAGYSPEIIAYAEELEVEIVTTELYPYSPVIDAQERMLSISMPIALARPTY
jgi:hypothetical protein